MVVLKLEVYGCSKQKFGSGLEVLRSGFSGLPLLLFLMGHRPLSPHLLLPAFLLRTLLKETFHKPAVQDDDDEEGETGGAGGRGTGPRSVRSARTANTGAARGGRAGGPGGARLRERGDGDDPMDLLDASASRALVKSAAGRSESAGREQAVDDFRRGDDGRMVIEELEGGGRGKGKRKRGGEDDYDSADSDFEDLRQYAGTWGLCGWFGFLDTVL